MTVTREPTEGDTRSRFDFEKNRDITERFTAGKWIEIEGLAALEIPDFLRRPK